MLRFAARCSARRRWPARRAHASPLRRRRRFGGISPRAARAACGGRAALRGGLDEQHDLWDGSSRWVAAKEAVARRWAEVE